MSRLNYHHLYYFWRVAREGKLTRVAETLHLSQSALSAQIRKLEDRMGKPLFERRHRALVLTEAGRRVFNYAEVIFTKGEELESLISRGIEPEYQRLRIGTLSTMSRNFIEGFIAPLLNQSGQRVHFSLHARDMANLLDGLARHELDVVLTNTQMPPSDSPDASWQSQLLARQPLSIIGPPDSTPGRPFPEGFDDMRWVLPGEHHEIRRAFDGHCSLYQYRPKILAEADDMAMLRLLARDSGALSVMPEVVVKDELQQGRLTRLEQLPNVYENFYAITLPREFMPGIVSELLARPLKDMA
ncbi:MULTISPECIES: LysR family transcriptional regulator [Halomonas]|uniref:LysR family transcriptional regulator n=2 Tax=Halomonas TaxID=2745 RepID=A0ABQ0U7Z1_9GAMM|nr:MULTISPECIES: LysR family transcriptional regulator [Halomonas]PSJ21048.1 LysR family transcriptional regulator [Halomonas sp. ND22Bw]KGE78189.1 LysR family transcriptional regulator [Halomonas salina]MDR5890585.1 LysR family transcriptional regulator [Halomonas salina]RAH38029.1 LysR family transcriptional regulator [Halomonas sp. SL1]WJY06050.1 LysR family transcriptional regulator [Halomonas halophila]